MERSESIAALAAALAKAQGTIQGAIKDTANPFFKSKYADLASVKDAVQIPLSTNGLSYVQVVHNPEHGVGVETVLMHSSGEWLSGGVVFVPVVKADAQGYGSALTYARRYSLSAITGVAPEDDDGNAAAAAAAAAKAKLAEVKPTTVHSPTKIAWEASSPEQQQFLTETAQPILAMLAKGANADAAQLLIDQRLEADEHTAIWYLFNSSQRSIMRTANEFIKGQRAK